MLSPARKPTLYFIGVTTAQSSIMGVFPAWARHLGLVDAEIRGVDLPLHADPTEYRRLVAFLKDDPLSLGALVTTHKIDIFDAAGDLFDVVDPLAELTREISCISKREGRLVCHAKDPIASGLALESFLGPDFFARTGAAVFAMGAGGSSIAITWYLMRRSRGQNVPSRIVVSNRSPARLDLLRDIHARIDSAVPVDYVLTPAPGDNDAVLARLPARSLVINATGLGKDAPGSPLTGAAAWPDGAIAWDLNYRGDLVFLEQARSRQAVHGLRIEDGWTYFLHGWTQVIAEVFGIDLPSQGPGFDALSHIARDSGGVRRA